LKSFVVLLVLPTKASIVTSQSKEKRFFEILSNSPFINHFKFDTMQPKAQTVGQTDLPFHLLLILSQSQNVVWLGSYESSASNLKFFSPLALKYKTIP
jgi:hypothetical protein